MSNSIKKSLALNFTSGTFNRYEGAITNMITANMGILFDVEDLSCSKRFLALANIEKNK